MSSPLIGSARTSALSPRWRSVILACVASSISPMRRIPSAVSSIALIMRLGFVVFAIGHLLQFLLFDGKRDIPLALCQPQRADLAPRQQLVGVDVLALVF